MNFKEAAKNLLPGREKDIDKISCNNMKDGRFPLQAELMNLDTNNILNYDEFYYRDTRLATQIIDPKSGEVIEWDDTAQKEELEIIMMQQPWLVTRKVQKSTVKLCIVVGSTELYKPPLFY